MPIDNTTIILIFTNAFHGESSLRKSLTVYSKSPRFLAAASKFLRILDFCAILYAC